MRRPGYLRRLYFGDDLRGEPFVGRNFIRNAQNVLCVFPGLSAATTTGSTSPGAPPVGVASGLGAEARLRQQVAMLTGAFLAKGAVVVGFSGGVDSALLAKIAHDALGARAIAVTVDSESFARHELQGAEAFARSLGLAWRVVQAREMDNPLYVANPGNRCYFCREEMSRVLRLFADREGIATVAMGVNASDLGETRPGHEAMRQARVWMPLLEVGATKEDVRGMARLLGLDVADKPAMACLSSRVEHGQPITVEVLRRVEAAEAWLRQRAFAQVRVRVHGELARIEVAKQEVPKLAAMAPEAVEELRRLGFRYVTVDLEGYRAGSMAGAFVKGP